MKSDHDLSDSYLFFCRGPFVSAIGKTWHPEHFACNSCKVSLQNQGFVEEQDKLFCEHCYNNFFAPKCAACDQPIMGVSCSCCLKCFYQFFLVVCSTHLPL